MISRKFASQHASYSLIFSQLHSVKNGEQHEKHFYVKHGMFDCQSECHSYHFLKALASKQMSYWVSKHVTKCILNCIWSDILGGKIPNLYDLYIRYRSSAILHLLTLEKSLSIGCGTHFACKHSTPLHTRVGQYFNITPRMQYYDVQYWVPQLFWKTAILCVL